MALLQQSLPFTVLKLINPTGLRTRYENVATVLTVYGIETELTSPIDNINSSPVATVLTVYGIETLHL